MQLLWHNWNMRLRGCTGRSRRVQLLKGVLVVVVDELVLCLLLMMVVMLGGVMLRVVV